MRRKLTQQQAFERWWSKNGARYPWGDEIAREVAHSFARVSHYRGSRFGRTRERAKPR